MPTVRQRYGRTDRQTDRRTDDLRWQYRALHYVHRAVKIVMRMRRVTWPGGNGRVSCPSVRSSHAGTVSKWRKLWSRNLHWRIPKDSNLGDNDQHAYKPTGSTTCALVDFTYRIDTLLETNQYVRCVLVDFSKAFDIVNHTILARKLLALQVPFIDTVDYVISYQSNAGHQSWFLFVFLLTNQ